MNPKLVTGTSLLALPSEIYLYNLCRSLSFLYETKRNRYICCYKGITYSSFSHIIVILLVVSHAPLQTNFLSFTFCYSVILKPQWCNVNTRLWHFVINNSIRRITLEIERHSNRSYLEALFCNLRSG